MTDVRLDYDRRWVEADPNATPQAWAATTVRRRWAERQLGDDPARTEAIIASVARIVDSIDTTALQAALLLYPAADEPVVTVVGLRTFDAAPGLTLDALGDELCIPTEMLEVPRDRSVIETPVGPAVRLVQRYRELLSPGVEEIREHVAYGWLVSGSDHEDVVVTVSTAFVDLVAASTWITAVDELAQSLTA
ncbi:MAG: hypothetical protein ACR2GH_20680 [Pseudonocardia sp.]